MYIPHLYREEDLDTLIAFMREHSFATIVSVLEGSPLATHLPLTVTRQGENVILRGHFARANPQWQALNVGETMVVFTGPHAYISPQHYQRHESVPTWNYLAVHAYGHARILGAETDSEGLQLLLNELIAQHEPAYQQQWDSLPDRYREGMMQGIVGFEMPVARLEGAAKLSQNKSQQEQADIARALSSSDDAAARATGSEMRRRLEAEAQEA